MQLLPHQRQSLHRMLQLEQLPQGFNSLMWQSVTLGGRQMHLSLTMGRLQVEPPVPLPTGGFLGACTLEGPRGGLGKEES